MDNLLQRMSDYADNLEQLAAERTKAYLEEKQKNASTFSDGHTHTDRQTNGLTEDLEIPGVKERDLGLVVGCWSRNRKRLVQFQLRPQNFPEQKINLTLAPLQPGLLVGRHRALCARPHNDDVPSETLGRPITNNNK
ncbi:hypothetical protein DPMN_174324 [Dreissena polymorpha]|uniref:Uncharacterized protein n=1 Tax=Dreissena polymorpha TaxID=45954 RepID=A0A9D4E634_DREPO|nr:hypothetical protein DPMN_174324 [Dreissena polymorpha]